MEGIAEEAAARGEQYGIAEENLTTIIWILRMVLPCILFWISFGPRLRIPWGPRGNCHSRDTFLEHRRSVLASNCPVPDSFANLIIVTEATAPMLFEKDKRKDTERDRDNDRGRQRPSKNDKRDRRPNQRDRQAPAPVVFEPAPQEVVAEEQGASEQQMHLESLVNFVAFNRLVRKRVFLLEEGCRPPPPPRPIAKVHGGASASTGMSNAATERANMEAQVVLRGALNVASRGGSVAQGLFAQLTDLAIDVQPPTFELMVEACIEAENLQAASDFLMRMEASGIAPGNDLLDRVMELYLAHKRATENEKKSEPPAPVAEPTPPASQPSPVQTFPAAQANQSWMHSDVGVDDGSRVGHAHDVSAFGQWNSALDTNVDNGMHVNAIMRDTTGQLTGADMSWGHSFADNHRWQPMMGSLGSHGREAATSRPTETDLADLPAFSVPDEFAVKRTTPDDSEEPLSESKRAAASSAKQKDKLSFDAPVFVPGPPLDVPQWFGSPAKSADISGNGFSFSTAAPSFEPCGDGATPMADMWEAHMHQQINSESYPLYPGQDASMGEEYSHSAGNAAYDSWAS